MNFELESIMLVDDSEMDNFFHSEIIRRCGAARRIVIAENAAEALEILKDNSKAFPSLIFLDINMPGMNGWEFIDALKKLGLPRSAIIVMLSTSLNPADRQRALEIPEIAAYRCKPLTKAMLEEIKAEFFALKS